MGEIETDNIKVRSDNLRFTTHNLFNCAEWVLGKTYLLSQYLGAKPALNIAVIKRSQICPMPDAQCPMPYFAFY